MNDSQFVNRNYFIFASLFVVFSFFIMKSFLFGMLWGVVLAISLWPICEYVSQKAVENKCIFVKPQAQDNAFLFTILFSIFFFTLAFYALSQLTGLYGLINDYISVNSNLGVLHYPPWFEKLPLGNKLIDFWQNNIATSQGLLNFASSINTAKILSVFSVVWGQVLDRLITMLVMIITLYFMLRNGHIVKQYYQQFFSYWFSPRSTLSVEKGVQALRGTINGVILVGIVEGVLLSIPLLMGGINAGLILGLAAGIAGVIPLLMPALILPCLAYLFFNGDTLWSIVGAVDLLIVWLVFENVIKPQMISKTVKVNTFLILIAMIGGMQILGPVGLFLGPAIVSMAVGMIKDFLKIASQQDIPELNDAV